MEKLTLTVFALCAIYPAFLQRVPENTKITPRFSHVESTLPSRLPRAISEEETATGYSKEYDHSNEVFQPSSKKLRLPNQPKYLARQVVKINRHPRDSIDGTKKLTDVPKPQKKSNVVMVKKPIPKFNEIDYDDDFQSKVIRAATRYVDSGEHEDEDFNLDDYDFDINHDEFIGRGKPLEPRQKIKALPARISETDSELDSTPKTKPVPPVIKIQSKVVVPIKSKTLNKREHLAVKVTKKVADTMKDDYYDDVSVTSTKTPELKRHAEEDSNEDSDDSKEYDRKPLRSIRSSSNNLFANKVEEKSAGKVDKVVGALPMFPQMISGILAPQLH